MPATANAYLLRATWLAALAGSAGAQEPATPQAVECHELAPSAADPAPATLGAPTLALATELLDVGIVDANNEQLATLDDLAITSKGEALAIADRDLGGIVAIPFALLQARLAVAAATQADAAAVADEDPQVAVFTLQSEPERLAVAPPIDKAALGALDETSIQTWRRFWSSETSSRTTTCAEDATANAPVSPAAAVHCVERVLDRVVTSPSGERLGAIQDVVIDVGAARVAYVVLLLDGAPGERPTSHAVPLEALAFGPDDQAVTLIKTDLIAIQTSPGIDLDRLPSQPSVQLTARVSLTDESFAQGTPHR